MAAAPAAQAKATPIGTRVADTLMHRWPGLDATPADCSGPANCFSMNFATVPPTPSPKFWEYTYGVPLVGLQRLYERTHDPRYLAYIKKYVDRYVDTNGTISYARPWPVNHDGKASPPNDPTIQDVIQPSTLLFGLYDATGDERYLKAMTATRQIFRSIKTSRTGAYWHKPSYPDQQWLDGIYMAEPFLVRYGALFADKVKPGDAQLCFRTATGQIEVAAAHTMDPKTKLYYHAWTDALDGSWRGLAPPTRVPPPAGATTSPVLWSRAIGWYIAGIVDVLEYLPASDPERPALRAILHNLAAGLERFQDRKTGLWYQVINVMAGPLPATGGYANERDRPAQPNWLETSASAIFAYSLAKAVRLGELPARYRAVAVKAWNGVKSRIDVDADGTAHIHGTVVGLSVGGTYNAYVNADVRGPAQLSNGELPAPASCPTAAQLPPGTTPPIACKYIYVRDDVPQGFGAVLLASSELEFTPASPPRHPAPQPVARSK